MCLWQRGGQWVGPVQVQGWITAILLLTPSIAWWRPALLSLGQLVLRLRLWRCSRSSSMARKCKHCSARSKTCLRQVDHGQLRAVFPYESLGVPDFSAAR
jgi:hypothetical protein